MKLQEIREDANPATRNIDERFNEVLALLTVDSRFFASETPAGEQFQVIVRRMHQEHVRRMSPDVLEQLERQLKDELLGGSIPLVVDSFEGYTFQIHQVAS